MKKANPGVQANPEFTISDLSPVVQRSPIVITVKALVPLMPFGNIGFEATQEIELIDNSTMGRSIETVDGLNRLRLDLAQLILPMVEAEVTRYASVLLKDPNPSYWLSNNSSTYKWFRIAYPDVSIPAMEAIIASKSIPNQGLE